MAVACGQGKEAVACLYLLMRRMTQLQSVVHVLDDDNGSSLCTAR